LEKELFRRGIPQKTKTGGLCAAHKNDFVSDEFYLGKQSFSNMKLSQK